MIETFTSTSSDEINIRIDQASMLKQRVIGSCIFVQAIIIYIAAMLWFGGSKLDTAIWALPTTFMVLVTYLYAQIKAPKGIDRENVDSYLKGHIIISCLTGIVWGGFAIFHIDWNAQYSLFVSSTIVATITVGGMLPGATYRPGFIALSTFMIVPFGLYVLVTGHDSLRLVGVAILIFYAFGLLTSARAQNNTRLGISANREREMTAKISMQNEIIQRAHHEKTRFLAATSHDLSQPLHAQGYFIEAMRKAISTPEQNTLLDKIEASWRAQGHLLLGLVDITRLDSGVIIPNLRAIDVKAEMQNLVFEFSEMTKAKSITLSTELEYTTAYTDPVLLSRIVRNILANAVKFTPRGGRIELRLSQNEGMLLISVRDNGIGVTPEDHERIFDEYVQIGNTNRNREKGLGLGLSIVQRLTKLLHIDMQFESELNKGTQFNLTLPVHANLDVLPPKIQDIERTFKSSPLIIIVDDEKAIREAMSALLTDWGCQLICSASGEEAIARLNETEETPTLLIIDKRLTEGENGHDVIRALREEVNESTPAILITGDLKGFDRMKPDADIQLMLKPVDPKEIKLAINEILMR